MRDGLTSAMSADQRSAADRLGRPDQCLHRGCCCVRLWFAHTTDHGRRIQTEFVVRTVRCCSRLCKRQGDPVRNEMGGGGQGSMDTMYVQPRIEQKTRTIPGLPEKFRHCTRSTVMYGRARTYNGQRQKSLGWNDSPVSWPSPAVARLRWNSTG